MRKREREEKNNNAEGTVKEKAFSEHTKEAFSALRDARGVGIVA